MQRIQRSIELQKIRLEVLDLSCSNYIKKDLNRGFIQQSDSNILHQLLFRNNRSYRRDYISSSCVKVNGYAKEQEGEVKMRRCEHIRQKKNFPFGRHSQCLITCKDCGVAISHKQMREIRGKIIQEKERARERYRR